MLSSQFSEQMSLRQQLGGLIAENNRLYPRPAGMDTASHGRPGFLAQGATIGEQNKILREKIASTQVSNEIGRGERPPTAERFG